MSVSKEEHVFFQDMYSEAEGQGEPGFFSHPFYKKLVLSRNPYQSIGWGFDPDKGKFVIRQFEGPDKTQVKEIFFTSVKEREELSQLLSGLSVMVEEFKGLLKRHRDVLHQTLDAIQDYPPTTKEDFEERFKVIRVALNHYLDIYTPEEEKA